MRWLWPVIVCGASSGCFEDPPIVSGETESASSSAEATMTPPTTTAATDDTVSTGPVPTTSPTTEPGTNDGSGPGCGGPPEPVAETWCVDGEWSYSADEGMNIECDAFPGGLPPDGHAVFVDNGPDGLLMHLRPAPNGAFEQGFQVTLPVGAELGAYCDPRLDLRVGCDMMLATCGASWRLEKVTANGSEPLGEGLASSPPEHVVADLSGAEELNLFVSWMTGEMQGPVVIVAPVVVEADG